MEYQGLSLFLFSGLRLSNSHIGKEEYPYTRTLRKPGEHKYIFSVNKKKKRGGKLHILVRHSSTLKQWDAFYKLLQELSQIWYYAVT